MCVLSKSEQLLNMMLDLSICITIHVALQKTSSILLRMWASATTLKILQKISSTKTKYVMLSETENLMPLRSLLWLASLTSRLRSSATTKNIKGDSGKPYINPLENLNNQEGEKFMSTANVTLFKQPKIQLTTEISIPICRKTRLNKVQSTLSYAFDRSNFRMESLRFILLT